MRRTYTPTRRAQCRFGGMQFARVSSEPGSYNNFPISSTGFVGHETDLIGLIIAPLPLYKATSAVVVREAAQRCE